MTAQGIKDGRHAGRRNRHDDSPGLGQDPRFNKTRLKLAPERGFVENIQPDPVPEAPPKATKRHTKPKSQKE